MRISDWSSDVCSSDLLIGKRWPGDVGGPHEPTRNSSARHRRGARRHRRLHAPRLDRVAGAGAGDHPREGGDRESGVEGKSVSVRVELGGCSNIKKTMVSECSQINRQEKPKKNK